MAKRKKSLTPAEIGMKWGNGMGAAGQAYIRGCQQPKRDPTAAACTSEASQRYLAGVQRSESSGLRCARLQAVGQAGWLKGCTDKGAANLAAAGQRKVQKYINAIQALQPVWQGMRAAADGVVGPKSEATAIAKVTAALQVLMRAGKRAAGGAVIPVPGFGG